MALLDGVVSELLSGCIEWVWNISKMEMEACLFYFTGGTIPKAIDVCCGGGQCAMVTEDLVRVGSETRKPTEIWPMIEWEGVKTVSIYNESLQCVVFQNIVYICCCQLQQLRLSFLQKHIKIIVLNHTHCFAEGILMGIRW